MRQRRCGDDSRIGNLYAVVYFIFLFQAPEYRDGIFDARFIDQHFLEAPFQRRVFFYMLAILVQRCRADAMQLAARERRLEHVAGIHRSFRLAGADHRVHLIDKQDDPAFLFGQVIENGFQALFEFSAKFRTGDQRAHVQR